MSDWKAGMNKDLVAAVSMGRGAAVELVRKDGKGEGQGWEEVSNE